MDRIPSLDRTDREILGLLQKDARISNKELAAQVHLAPSSCHARVRRLEERGVVRRYSAEIDPKAVGVGIQALLFVRLSSHTREVKESILAYAESLEEVTDVFHIAGAEDLVLHVVATGTEHLRRVIMNSLSARPEIARMQTALVFEHRRRGELPDLTDAGPG